MKAKIGDSDIVICSARHYDEVCVKVLEALKLLIVEEEQGFIDQFGRFLTRTEAWQIAAHANQIIRRVGGDDADGGTLYSENLY